MPKFDQKFIGAALILAAWYALVLQGLAPVTQFIDTLQVALAGLGVYHVASNRPPPATTVASVQISPAQQSTQESSQ
jgi:hypothetical protein